MPAFASASQNPICVRPSASATLKWLGGFADDMSDKPHRDRAEPAIIRRYHVAARHRDRAGKRTAQQDFARLQLFSPLRQAICQPREIGRATSELQSLMRISYAVFCLKK